MEEGRGGRFEMNWIGNGKSGPRLNDLALWAYSYYMCTKNLKKFNSSNSTSDLNHGT